MLLHRKGPIFLSAFKTAQYRKFFSSTLWACFTNVPNAAASIVPTLSRQSMAFYCPNVRSYDVWNSIAVIVSNHVDSFQIGKSQKNGNKPDRRQQHDRIVQRERERERGRDAERRRGSCTTEILHGVRWYSAWCGLWRQSGFWDHTHACTQIPGIDSAPIAHRMCTTRMLVVTSYDGCGAKIRCAGRCNAASASLDVG